MAKEVDLSYKKFYCEYAEETIESLVKKSFFLKRFTLKKNEKSVILNIPKPLLEKCKISSKLSLEKKHKEDFYSMSFTLYTEPTGKTLKEITSNVF